MELGRANLVVLGLGMLLAGCREPGLREVRGQVRVQPSPVDFGGVWVGTQGERSVTVENLAGTSLSLTLATDAPFSASPSRLTLGASGTTKVWLRFQPRQAGPLQGVLRLGLSEGTLEVPLGGEGLPVPECVPSGPCREARFSPEEGGCVEVDAPEGLPCGGACMQGGECSGGICMGTPVVCADDGDTCTVEACHPQVGCTREDRRARCEADASPCMAASCRADGSCVLTPVADGTVCGEQSCEASPRCQQGACVSGPHTRQPGSLLCATALGVGTYHGCASLEGGTLACWGVDLERLGFPIERTRLARPRLLTGATDVESFAVGNQASCVRGSDAGWSCLGWNFGGWLGMGPVHEGSNYLALTPVPELAGALQVEPGYGRGCARLADDSLSCVKQRPPPAGYEWDGRFEPVAGMEGVRQLSMESYCECAARTDGSVWCWFTLEPPPPSPLADGGQGQAVEPDAGFFRFEPMAVEGVEDAVAVATGERFGCALLSGGEVTCWGRNTLGQLGRAPTRTDAGVVEEPPSLVPDLEDAVGLCAGRAHACALRGDGTLRCWGDNTHGQLGTGATSPPPSAPVQPLGLERVVAVDCGFQGTCALQEEGAVWCWGTNSYGEAGQGPTGAPPSPLTVPLPSRLTW
jgi:hypothetical protein